MPAEDWTVGDWAASALARFPDALCLVGADGVVLWAGGATESVTGWPPESVVGRRIEDLLHPDDHRVGIEQFLLMLHGELPSASPTAHFRVRASDEGWVPVSIGATTIAAGDGEPVILLSVRKTLESATVDEVLEQLVSGTPARTVLRSVLRLWQSGLRLERAGLTVRTEDEMLSIGTALPAPLDGTADVAGSPWERARELGETVKLTSTRDLPPVLREAAEREGLAGGWFVPIPVPGTTTEGMLLVWTEPASPLHLIEKSAVVASTVRLVTLILGWHEHVATLTAAAGTDHLTGAASRSALIDALSSGPLPRRRTLFYIDLDGFKPVNDRYGHRAGDDVLVEVTRRLRGAVRADDLVARIGGDEFAVLCDGLQARSEAITIADRVISVLAMPIHLADGRIAVDVSASIGIAEASSEWPDTASLLEVADDALLEAKAAGRNRWHYADSSSRG